MADDQTKSLSSLSIPTATGVVPFKRILPRSGVEILADAIMGTGIPKKLPWWGAAMTGVLTAAGVTAAIAWQWFVLHAVFILGPISLGTVAAFLALRIGAMRREQRLLAEVDQHTNTAVEKARRDLIAKIREQGRREDKEATAAIMEDWNGTDPFGRLLQPRVFHVFLTNAAVSTNTIVANVYYLPRMLYCLSCTVCFRRKSPDGSFANIAEPSMTLWSEEIPGSAPEFNVPQANPVSVSASEVDDIRSAQNTGSLDVIVTVQYAVDVGSGVTARRLPSQKFQFSPHIIIN